MPAQLITPPAAEPVTLQEAKEHLHLETALDDSYVGVLISAARQYTEQVCWRGLVTQTWELVLESFQGEDTLELGTRGRRYGSGQSGFNELPRGNLGNAGFLPHIELPKGNLGTVSSIKYIDVNGVQQTLDTSVYAVDNISTPGLVRLAYSQYWPPTRWPQWDAVRIRYTVGWDVTAGVWAGPTPLKQAMLMLVAQMYEHRISELDGRISQVQFAYDSLISTYRLVRI